MGLGLGLGGGLPLQHPELAPMWEDIKQNGQAAMKKYWDDPEWISKVSEKMGRLRVKPRGEVKTLHDAAKAGDVAKAEALLAGEGSGARPTWQTPGPWLR